MKYSPIAIFGYRRSHSLKRAIESLARCPEASASELYVFIDGPRNDMERQDTELSASVAREIPEGMFASVNISVSDVNHGLGPSVIAGVGKILETHGRVIVVEDDLEVTPNFLTFLNAGLERYASDRRVFSVCGYSNRVKLPEGYPHDAYFAPRSSSWGWGTWADRWKRVDWTFDRWEEWKNHRKGFNRWGGSDCFGMLDACRRGANRSWAIRFCFAQYLENALSLFPTRSLVENEGFDGSGTNCRRYNRFTHDMDSGETTDFRLPDDAVADPAIVRSALSYHSLRKRLWSRLMYMLE